MRTKIEIECCEGTAERLRDLFQEMANAHTDAVDLQSQERAGVPDGYVKNAKGWMMPEASVKANDLLEGDFVDSYHCLMEAVGAGCRFLKLSAFSESHALVGMIVGDAGGSGATEQGKVTLQNLRATRRVVIDRRDTVAFGPEVAAARDRVMACVRKWSDGANANLVQLAMAAFQANGNGELSVSKVAALWRIECADEEWQGAMAALKDALRPTGTATYLRFHRRVDPDGKWELVEAKV